VNSNDNHNDTLNNHHSNINTIDTTKASKIAAPKKLNVLEVGAINIQLQQCHWLNVRSIDINSQHPSIEEIDFFDIIPTSSYDVVVCSMVINCVTNADKRGDMLCRLYSQIKSNGILFLILPIRCINSKHVGIENFNLLLNLVGFKHLVVKRVTPKLIFYVLGKKNENIDNGDGSDNKYNEVNDNDIRTHKKKKTKKEVKIKNDDNVNDKTMGWHDLIKNSILKNVEKGKNDNVLRYFCKDYSAVPTGEFCISLASIVE
jgi:2-polyprenyl-3-methyl-5-hydroxy-6-metoxy-1,4-benzoquinol methylase